MKTVGNILLVLLVTLVCSVVRGEDPTAEKTDKLDAAQLDFFESSVRPLLVTHCYSCHSRSASDAGKLSGGLLLDSRDGVRQGGDSGAALIPGNSDASLLIQSVRYLRSDLQMPPDGPLSAANVAILEKWVAMGAPDPRDAALGGTGAQKAGIDMDMVGEGFLTTLKKSLVEGKITTADIDAAAKRILEAKYDLGLFQDPYKYLNETRQKTEIYTTAHRAEARNLAAQSIVLVKNDNQILPLKKSGTIALIGPLANNAENMAGTWSVATVQKNSIPVLKGFEDAVGTQAKIMYAKGSNLDDDPVFEDNATMFSKSLNRDSRTKQEMLDEAITVAKQSDVIVLALGESAEMSGECSSRTNLEIPQAQKDLLKEMLQLGKPVVLLLFNGRPMVITEENAKVPAILDVWFGGSEAGHAIADVVFGAVNPSGKLSTTFPRSVGQIPIFYAHKNTGRPLHNTEGKFEKFRSNYLDERNEPLYPFGYGLSYTTFTYGKATLSAPKMNAKGKITVSVPVTNTGNYDGKEVVQLYIRDVVGSVTRPVRELKGFQKIELKKGETQTVTFEITENDLKFYNNALEFKAEPGKFEVFVGTNSDTQNKVEFELIR